MCNKLCSSATKVLSDAMEIRPPAPTHGIFLVTCLACLRVIKHIHRYMLFLRKYKNAHYRWENSMHSPDIFRQHEQYGCATLLASPDIPAHNPNQNCTSCLLSLIQHESIHNHTRWCDAQTGISVTERERRETSQHHLPSLVQRLSIIINHPAFSTHMKMDQSALAHMPSFIWALFLTRLCTVTSLLWFADSVINCLG